MKLIEYKPEINTDFSSIPQVMTVKEVLGLLYETKLKWRDPEGLDEITPKLWEAAKPKYYHDLTKKYPAPIIFGTFGERSEYIDIATAFGYAEICKEKNILLPEDYFEIHWLSESHIQEAEWIDRKRKCPSLTVKDLQWVDKMVDEIFEKHTRDLSKESFKMWSENFIKLPFKKFLGPLF